MKKLLKPIIAVLCLFLIVSMGRSAFGLFGRDKSIKEAEKKVEELEAEQQALLAIKEEVDTQEFIEKEARDKLGLAKEGEVILVLPPDEVLKRFSPDFEEEVRLEELPIRARWVRLYFNFLLAD